MIGINVMETVDEDLRFPKFFGVFLAVFLPLLLYLAGLNKFLRVVSFTGGVLLAFEAIFVITMWRKAFLHHLWRRASVFLYPVLCKELGFASSCAGKRASWALWGLRKIWKMGE